MTTPLSAVVLGDAGDGATDMPSECGEDNAQGAGGNFPSGEMARLRYDRFVR